MKRLEIDDPEIAWITIQEEIFLYEESRYQDRLYALLLLCEGLSCQQVADIFDEDRRTIQRWVTRYQTQGLDGLLDGIHSGRPKSLNSKQWNELKRVITEPCKYSRSRFRHWESKHLVRHLENEYSISLSLRQCQRIFQRILIEMPNIRRR